MECTRSSRRVASESFEYCVIGCEARAAPNLRVWCDRRYITRTHATSDAAAKLGCAAGGFLSVQHSDASGGEFHGPRRLLRQRKQEVLGLALGARARRIHIEVSSDL